MYKNLGREMNKSSEVGTVGRLYDDILNKILKYIKIGLCLYKQI